MMVEGIVTIVVILVVILVFLSFVPLNLWISALASGVHVSIFTLVGMRIRRVSPVKIVTPLIKAEKAGLNIVNADAGCCGISGSYGFHKDNYETSMKVGQKLFDAINGDNYHKVVCDCGTCLLYTSPSPRDS